MSRSQPDHKPAQTVTSKKSQEAPPRKESYRDLVEQIVVALILAFLIRGFEAEAFVIPTGSMAPTLMGRHKEVACPQCGRDFTVNASDSAESQVAAATCQNCRAPARIDEDPSYNGDRILVMKFLYNLPFLPGAGKPSRWDVIVFNYPEEPEVNYIKRLVGLPGEELRILQGNILTRPQGSTNAFRLERRPLVHQRAMQMLVWDDAYQPAALAGKPEWQRWRPTAEAGWKQELSTRAGSPSLYTASASAGDWSELRYQHRVPDPLQWIALLRNEALPGKPRSTLITDFYSYNSRVLDTRRYDPFDWFQPHWVGDLTLSARVQAREKAAGMLRLELISGGESNRCLVDLATGKATLFHGDQQLGDAVDTPLRDTRAHDVEFANVDERLTLWVDGKTPFAEGRVYGDGAATGRVPTAEDLQPARVAVKGAAVDLSGLVLKRDIYYTLKPGYSDFSYYDPNADPGKSRPLDVGGTDPADNVARKFDVLADPSRFPELADLAVRDFNIRPAHYMMMGDNSPNSKDGRDWSTSDQLAQNPETGWDPNLRESWEVPEHLIIGKAFYIYWPHGKLMGPSAKLPVLNLRVPFRPYFERMKWIR